MKIKLLILLFLLSLSLSSLTLIDGENAYDINLEKLNSFEQKSVKTQREKNGEVKNETWKGVDIELLLSEYQISDVNQLRFTSEDNYQVRLNRQEIEEYQPIIALQKNEESLDEATLRLIVPQMRDMFWIQGISAITVELENEMPLPYTLYVAESIVKKIQITANPEPFTRVQGYKFSDLVEAKYPVLQVEFLLVSADGVSHKLDYEKYLKNAVLIVDEDQYNLQSPDMPGGMWIKNLVYIQALDRAIFFKDKINGLHDLSKITGWKKLPSAWIDQNGKRIDPTDSFDATSWDAVEKITWQDQ